MEIEKNGEKSIEGFVNQIKQTEFLLGDRARFPLGFRPNVLITAAIVVAVLR